MKRINNALSRARFIALACTTAILGSASIALAEGDAQLGPSGVASAIPEVGLTIAVGGAGLNHPPDLREGDISINIGGPVRAAYLYWAGGGDEGAVNPVEELTLHGTTFQGVKIGVEHEIEDAIAYRANVTSLVQTAFGVSGPGNYNFHVEDPTPIDNFDRLHGAGLIVLYINPADPSVNAVSIFDGADYAFRLFTGANQVTVPVTFNFAPVASARTAKLALFVGEAKPIRPDRIDITTNSGTQQISNSLLSADGGEWDTVLRDVTIPANGTFITSQLISPVQFTNSDSLVWVLAATQIPVGPGTGACCLQDGNCQIMTASACGAAGGMYQGDGTACSPSLCVGKCCLPVAPFCQVLTAADCALASGQYSPFEDCNNNNCPVPTGGCCLPTGSCASLTEEECTNLGGQLWVQGIDCTAIDCPGACCFNDGSCQFIGQIACNIAGGSYRGDGMLCAQANCSVPMGACCFPNGTCAQATQADCTAAGGAYSGDASLCNAVRCEGACCLPDGTCTNNQTPGECAGAGGTYQGLNSSCATANCPKGACCLPSGACQNNTTQPQCATTLGGQWKGLSTTCATVQCLGACCLNDGTCEQRLQANCTAAQGMSWHGPGSSCANITCPGACCLQDGSCVDGQTKDQCGALGGDFMGLNSTCATARCDGACCLPSGQCVSNQTLAECNAVGGNWQGLNAACGAVRCEGACCLANGTCAENMTLNECNVQGGTYQGLGSTCATAQCGGACCLLDGTCQQMSAAQCAAAQGSFNGLGSLCANVQCLGACCLSDGSCTPNVSKDDCGALGGDYMGLNSSCALVRCQGACCLQDGSCVAQQTVAECQAQGGNYQGLHTSCAGANCTPTPPGHGCSPKGSLIIISKVEIRWNAAGNLLQDTFIQLTNDYPDTVRVKLYYVNGDPPLAATANERAHPGWNWANNTINLTGDQPTYWSALTGRNSSGVFDPTFSPFTVLDPGFPPGRPDPEVAGERMLRGFIIAFAINANSAEIRWNHLAATVTLVHYQKASAWTYTPCSIQVNTAVAAHGQPTGTPGVLNLNGFEYAQVYDELLMNFYAVGSMALNGPRLVQVDTDVTLHPVDADLRQETTGPVTTKAHYLVWNQNESKLSGAYRCITCWDQTLLSSYGIPNHFKILALQTNAGKARIDGLASQLCNFDLYGPGGPGSPPDGVLDVISQNAAMLGLRAHHLQFDTANLHAVSGTIMFGMGAQSATIRYDTIGAPPEQNGGIKNTDEMFDMIESQGVMLPNGVRN